MPRTVRLDTLRKCRFAGDVEILGVPTRTYHLGGCRIFKSHEPQGWHLSISHPSRYPSFDEIAEARYQLLPDDVTMAMIFPPRGEYVNLHENCFHLFEIEGE